MASIKLEHCAHCATIVAALVTVGGLYYGVTQFAKTQEDARRVYAQQEQALDQERDSKAMDLFVKYNELMSEAAPGKKSGEGGSNYWRDNLAIAIAESIFRFRRNDSGWKQTVVWMLSNHTSYLKKNGLNCPTYDPDFVKLANTATQANLCRP